MADPDVDVEADDETLSDEASVYESCTDSNDNSDDDQDEESNDDDDDDDDDGDEQHEQTEDNDPDISLNDDDDNPNSSQCPVCLMTLTGQQLGTPNNCDHVFCFLCISEWSKNSNTCPVDRTKFDEILVHTTKKGPVIKRVKVEDKKVLTDQDWEQAPTYCEICEQCNREAMMLLCDGCDRGYHMFCLTPRLYEVPAGDWYCDTCFVIRNETSLDEGVPVADLISSSSGISEATMPSNSDRASSTRGRGRSRRGTGSRTSTARRSRSSSTRSRRKSKRGRGRKRGSTRTASSSTRKRKGKTTKRKTSKRSIKKSPTKKRKTTENNVYQPSLILGLRTGERLGKRGSSSNDRARPLGSRTALSIFGDEFALHDFEAEVDDATKEKPFISPRRTNNSTDVLLSIMDGIEVLHDEDARVSRDGSVLPSESHDKTSPPKSSSNSPEKTKTTPQKEDTHQSPVEKVSPLKRPSSTSPVDNEYGFKVKKVSFAGISDGTVEEKSNDSNDIAGPSRDHPRGYSPDISQESKNSSLDHSPEQSREQQSRDHGHVAERSRDLSHDDLRKHLSELSRHRVHNPRDYSRDRSHISRDSGDFSFGHPRKYKSDDPMKDFSRDNSRHSRDTMDFKRKYKGNNSRSTRDLKDFSRDHSRDFSKGHSSGQPSRISPSLRGESPPLITCKQRESRKISSSSYHEHFHHSTATAAEQAANVGDVGQSRDGDLLRELPHFDIPRMSSSRSREVEISRPCLLSRLGDPCMSSASSTETSSSQSLSSRYNHSSDSPTESMMASRSDVMKPQTLSSRFSNQSPRVPMATISSSGDVNMRQTLSSRFSDPSVSPVVSTATATSSKPRLIEFKSKSNELVANVVPDRQKLPTLPSLASNSTLPTLPRLKSFKPSDSQSSSRPKLKGLSTSRDKKTFDGYPKPDSSYRQNLAIIDMLRAKKSTLKAEIKKDDVTPVTQARQTSTEGYSKLPPSFSQTELNHTHSDANFHRPKLSSLLCQSSRKSCLPVAIVRPRTADCESEVSLKAEAKRELGTSTGSAGISNVSSRGGASISSDDDERLHNRRKGIARLQRLTSIKDTVRLVLQPFYDHREISRTEFKDIFMRAVQKVNESSQDVNYLRIADLVKKYVKKYKGLRIQSGQIMTSE